MTTSKAPRLPSIHMIDTEADILTNLALGFQPRMPDVARQLLDEIARARLHAADRIAPDVVTMHSKVEFLDEASGTERTIELVYPRDADISVGRVSIMTPVGAGLIGMRAGDAILWPDRDGRKRKLTIVKVEQRKPSA